VGVVPPFVAVAVNVIDVPGQAVVEGLAEMLTDAGRVDDTAIVRALEVAGLAVTQARFEVIIQVITSPLFNVVLE
jgi:hypothetical protein